MIKKRLQNTDKQKEEKKNHPLDLTTHNSLIIHNFKGMKEHEEGSLVEKQCITRREQKSIKIQSY